MKRIALVVATCLNIAITKTLMSYNVAIFSSEGKLSIKTDLDDFRRRWTHKKKFSGLKWRHVDLFWQQTNYYESGYIAKMHVTVQRTVYCIL